MAGLSDIGILNSLAGSVYGIGNNNLSSSALSQPSLNESILKSNFSVNSIESLTPSFSTINAAKNTGFLLTDTGLIDSIFASGSFSEINSLFKSSAFESLSSTVSSLLEQTTEKQGVSGFSLKSSIIDMIV